jgi:hypothetical protein
MGVTGYMVRPTVRFMYLHRSTMARPSQVAIRSPQHKPLLNLTLQAHPGTLR